MATTKARRGDLVAVVQERKTFQINPCETIVHTTIELRTVSSITREGSIKVTTTHYGSQIQRAHEEYTNPTYLVVPAASVDVAGCMAAFKARQWSTLSEMGGKPFDSVDECREFVRSFRVAEVAA